MRPASWGEAGALEEGAQTRRQVEHVSGVPGGRAWAAPAGAERSGASC